MTERSQRTLNYLSADAQLPLSGLSAHSQRMFTAYPQVFHRFSTGPNKVASILATFWPGRANEGAWNDMWTKLDANRAPRVTKSRRNRDASLTRVRREFDASLTRETPR